MGKKITIITSLLVLVTILIFGFESLSTTQTGLEIVRVDAGEDAASQQAAFAVFTQGNFANKSGTAWQVPDTDDESPANAVGFYLTTDGNNKTFSAACYGYKAVNGPAQLVCTVAATGGQQLVIAYPVGDQTAIQRNWVDTVVITDRWPKTVSSGSSGNGNDVATMIWWDTMGCRFFKWYIWDADGSGSEARFVSVWGTYF